MRGELQAMSARKCNLFKPSHIYLYYILLVRLHYALDVCSIEGDDFYISINQTELFTGIISVDCDENFKPQGFMFTKYLARTQIVKEV